MTMEMFWLDRESLIKAFAEWYKAIRKNPENFVSEEQKRKTSIRVASQKSADTLIRYLKKVTL